MSIWNLFQVLGCSAIAILIAYSWVKIKQKYGKTWKTPKIGWNTAGVIACGLLLLFWLLPWIIGDWWWSEVVKTKWSLQFVTMLVIASLMLRPGPRPFSEKFGAFVIVILVVGFIWNFTNQEWAKKEFGNWWTTLWSETPVSTTASASKASTEDARHYLNNITDSNKAVAIAAERKFRAELREEDVDLAMQVIFLESSDQQFEDDGETVLRNHNSDGIDDVGVWQIHETKAHLAKAKELTEKTGKDYSLYTLEGNLNMGVWIWQNEGPESWVTLAEAREILGGSGQNQPRLARRQPEPEVVRVNTRQVARKPVCTEGTIIAPVDDWSEEISTGMNQDWVIYLSFDGPIWLQDAEGKKIPLDKQFKYEIDWDTDYFTIKSRTNKYRGQPETDTAIMVTTCKP